MSGQFRHFFFEFEIFYFNNPEFINSCETENIQIYEFNVKLDIEIEITYLDEDSSYYDKEDGEYLFSNYITAKEKHNTEFKLVILCDIKDLEKEDFFKII